MYRLLAIPTFCCLTALAAGEVYSWHQIRSYSKATVISTWPWKGPNDAAWRNLDHPSGSAISAVVAGCTEAEEDKSIPTVGAGGSPDENGNTTLSAMVMDGDSMNVSFLITALIHTMIRVKAYESNFNYLNVFSTISIIEMINEMRSVLN